MVLVVVTGLQATGKSTLAEIAAGYLGTSVLAHDWAMSGLRPYPEIQTTLDAMHPPGHRRIGWSILWALARAQLRQGRSIVLDGVAGASEIEQSPCLANEEGARSLVVMTSCADERVHRSRVEGRQRHIPNWYELDWNHVETARNALIALDDIDLRVETTASIVENADSLRELLDRCF